MIIDQKPALSGCCVKMPRCSIAGRVTASPLRLSLGLYHGEQIRLPLLEAIRGYVPPPPPPGPVQRVAPNVIRLDSMSLFDTGEMGTEAWFDKAAGQLADGH
ncbi:outer membrane protein [Klebsiella pneumoniae]|uniref:Outer membrane protein n=1 Tax=Klebsiella pneumoniae TaxID=573 RepID=A0A378BCC3_KLEPN|nr:outer membrane protein [Klebsiella pneumoniae]